MKLRMRQKSKRDQALDAVASLAKTWSEWRLGKRATKTVAKGAKKASSSVPDAAKGTPLKIAGLVALVGGIGAVAARKLRGGGRAEPLYTPPPPPAPLPDMQSPPPSPVVVEDLEPEPEASQPAAEPAPENADEPAIPADPGAGAEPDPVAPAPDKESA